MDPANPAPAARARPERLKSWPQWFQRLMADDATAPEGYEDLTRTPGGLIAAALVRFAAPARELFIHKTIVINVTIGNSIVCHTFTKKITLAEKDTEKQ